MLTFLVANVGLSNSVRTSERKRERALILLLLLLIAPHFR